MEKDAFERKGEKLMVRGKKRVSEKKERSGKREKARGLMGSWLINPE